MTLMRTLLLKFICFFFVDIPFLFIFLVRQHDRIRVMKFKTSRCTSVCKLNYKNETNCYNK